MGEKKAPRLTPEQNEARQTARAAKRERDRDVRIVALMASVLHNGTRYDRIAEAWALLAAAKEGIE
jgi:hypothetical protein